MRRLALEPRDCRPRSQHRTPNGLDDNRNGALLSLASEHFDVFITVDRNLSFQQNLSLWPIAVVVLQARSNRLADLLALVPDLLLTIQTAKPGAATLVGTPPSFGTP
jgi:hypothetical protein